MKGTEAVESGLVMIALGFWDTHRVDRGSVRGH